MPLRLLFLDRHADQGAPLRPGAVVVAHFGVTKQVVKREPGMTAALTDAAVSHNFFIGSHAFAAIDSTQFLRRFKGAILAYCCSPRDISRAGDMAAALRTFLRQIRGSQQFSAVLSRRAHIDQGDSPLP